MAVGRFVMILESECSLLTGQFGDSVFFSFARAFACAPFPMNCRAVDGIVARPASLWRLDGVQVCFHFSRRASR